jgi:hypothetical protein
LYEGMTDSNGRYLKDGYMMRQPAFTSNPEWIFSTDFDQSSFSSI